MTCRLIRAEIEAQAGTRWADFILQQGEFAGPRDSYPPRRDLMQQRSIDTTAPATIPELYERSAGETVSSAVARMHAQGDTITAAAKRIGYLRGSSLRKYLACKGMQNPWGARSRKPAAERRTGP